MNQYNLTALAEFYEKAPYGVCFLEGQSGSFKTELLNESLNSVSDRLLVFRFRCFEATTLDDIFLAFFEDLKKYSQKKRITLKKIETNSISHRINSYLASLNVPAVIVIDSLENIFNKKNSVEKEEFLRYIEHLNSMQKFKIVLVSTSFASSVFEFSDSLHLTTEPFSKEQMIGYMKHSNVKLTDDTAEKLYEITRGNQNYIYITSNLITTLKTGAQALVSEFAGKRISYEDFVLQKLVTFVPDKVKKMLNVLSLLNVGIGEKYLISEKFFSRDQLNYMLEKDILSNEYGVVFLKTPLKKYLQSSIAHFERIKIHTLWRDFYTSQLPLKPNERAVLISRNTMRAQIEYHSSFVLAQKSRESEPADMSLMSYLNSNLTAWNLKNTNIDAEDNVKKRPEKPESLKNKDNRFEKYALTKEELSLLSLPVDMRKKEEASAREFVYRTIEQKEEENKKQHQSLKELYNTALELEKEHDIETAFIVYAKALALRSDEDFYEYEPVLLEKLAVCAKKMNKTSEAIDFYNKLTELYSSRNEIDNMNEVRLEIAQIYKETYKINHARVIYENFINKKSPASDSTLARSYIELAGIEEELSNNDKAVEYYKKAFGLINDGAQLKSSVLSGAYFKYALILDDFNRTQAALDFYQKSILTQKEDNIYLSAAYTNIAGIIKESGNPSKAAEYYKLALKTDLSRSNYEGVYYICLKLAMLYEESEPQKVLDLLLKSLSAAKRTREPLYITNAYIELGDYYSSKNENAKALKALLNAKNYVSPQDDASSIDLRINDLKKTLDSTTIQNITKETAKHGRKTI